MNEKVGGSNIFQTCVVPKVLVAFQLISRFKKQHVKRRAFGAKQMVQEKPAAEIEREATAAATKQHGMQ